MSERVRIRDIRKGRMRLEEEKGKQENNRKKARRKK